jgi:hypothetical protein
VDAPLPLGGAARLFAALLITALCLKQAGAHPSHASYAEVEWSEEGTLDVALQVTPEDLERALSRRAGRSVVLVDDPFVREQLTAYLQRHFALSTATAPLRLIGMQVAYRDTWIYFSLPARREADARLRNTLLFDLEPTQSNRVRRLWAPQAPVLVFDGREPERSLAVNAETETNTR